MDSIVLLAESFKAFDRMSDEDAGAILKALLRHANGQDPCLSDSPVVQAVYPLVESQVDRMAALREKRAASGRAGGEAKANNAVANSSKPVAKPSNEAATAKQNVPPIPIPKPKKERNILTDIPKDPILDEEPVSTAFKDFESMRKQIKKPLTDTARERARKRLKELAGGDKDKAVQILNQSVDHCWADLYELKSNVVIKKPNTFFDFDQRKDDLDAIVRAQL